ncbi:hypothetical protein JRQ81_017167 [Phrynocephalus forsythii]|uniref:Uncharacterized protein n=1 Tax=Phrynocephalus forsythii TaxID=171643 RepID=A0A9Q1B025_9SAUR|nr:hypothetical protein JRQ81_017167 [Phrynocephalus forsythii]
MVPGQEEGGGDAAAVLATGGEETLWEGDVPLPGAQEGDEGARQDQEPCRGCPVHDMGEADAPPAGDDDDNACARCCCCCRCLRRSLPWRRATPDVNKRLKKGNRISACVKQAQNRKEIEEASAVKGGARKVANREDGEQRSRQLVGGGIEYLHIKIISSPGIPKLSLFQQCNDCGYRGEERSYSLLLLNKKEFKTRQSAASYLEVSE